MKGILITIIFCIYGQAFAEEIVVRSANISYRLELKKEYLSYQSHLANFNIENKKCNQESYEFFFKEFHQKLKKRVTTKKSAETVELKKGDHSIHLNRNSALVNYLYKIPAKLKKLKLIARSECE